MDKLDQKREDILDAAMHCLARYGVIKTTLDDIARLVGINKATLYYYYKNKEAIFSDAIEREGTEFIDQVKENLKKKISAKDKLYTFLKTYHSYFRSRVDILELNAQAMVENHTFMRKMHNCVREKNIDLMKEIIREGIDKGEFRRIDAGRVADVLRYVFESRMFEYFLDSMDKPTNEPDIAQT